MLVDVSDLAECLPNNLPVISTIQSNATIAEGTWYDFAVTDQTVYIFSEVSNKIEMWDLTDIGAPQLYRNYPVYDKILNVKPNTYDYDEYNDLFFITGVDNTTDP